MLSRTLASPFTQRLRPIRPSVAPRALLIEFNLIRFNLSIFHVAALSGFH
jgi:hypothetical protein